MSFILVTQIKYPSKFLDYLQLRRIYFLIDLHIFQKIGIDSKIMQKLIN